MDWQPIEDEIMHLIEREAFVQIHDAYAAELGNADHLAIAIVKLVRERLADAPDG